MANNTELFPFQWGTNYLYTDLTMAHNCSGFSLPSWGELSPCQDLHLPCHLLSFYACSLGCSFKPWLRWKSSHPPLGAWIRMGALNLPCVFETWQCLHGLSFCWQGFATCDQCSLILWHVCFWVTSFHDALSWGLWW